MCLCDLHTREQHCEHTKEKFKFFKYYVDEASHRTGKDECDDDHDDDTKLNQSKRIKIYTLTFGYFMYQF